MPVLLDSRAGGGRARDGQANPRRVRDRAEGVAIERYLKIFDQADHPTLHREGGPRTLTQKLRQMRLAWALESNWSKREILEAYLNLVTFRGELQGVAAAAAVLFALWIGLTALIDAFAPS